MKIRSVGAELFYADGETDMTKLIVAFCNFAKGHNKPEAFHIGWGGSWKTQKQFTVSLSVIQHNVCTSKAGFSYYHSYRLWTSILFTETPVKRSKFFRQG